MRREDINRLLRGLFFLFVVLGLILWGLLPNDFSKNDTQISPFLFAFSGAFIIRRPKSAASWVMILSVVFYALYNDEGLVLGAFLWLAFMIFIHSLQEFVQRQSFIIEWTSLTILYCIGMMLKNLILQIFFTPNFSILQILYFTLIFAIIYPIFTFLINFVLGQSQSQRST